MSGPFVINPQTLGPTDALELLQDAMGEVIDLGTDEDNADRPAWAMGTLQKLRELEFFLGEIVRAQKGIHNEPLASEERT